MPDEPNQNVADQLKAWARKRRAQAGAPFELHPARRRLLQDEVARTFAKKSDELAAPCGGWWRMVWPRFALVGSLCVALVAVAAILLPGLAKSKSKAQQLALVRDGEKVLPAAPSRDDAPAEVARSSRSGVDVSAQRLGDGAAKAPASESAPTPKGKVLAESKPLEQEALVLAEHKDEQSKAVEQPAKVEARQSSEKNRQLELSYSDKAKEASPPAAIAPVTGGVNVENGRGEGLLRQRYGLSPGQGGVVTGRADEVTDQQKVPAAPPSTVAGPQVALDGAHAARSNGGVGGGSLVGAGGEASNTREGANVFLFNERNGATTNVYSLTLARPGRAAAGQVVSLAGQSEGDRPRTGGTSADYAVVPSRQTAQRYAQVRTYRLNFNSPPMPDVLNSFQVEQNGRQLRVVDADGSVYDGAIEPPVSGELTRRSVSLQTAAVDLKKNAEEKLAAGAAASNLAAVAGVDRLAPQNILFRVAGTNRTLNQLVVFEGNILANMTQTNGVPPVAEWIADHPAANAPQRGSWLQGQPLPSGLIQGQATIGESNRIQINAAPVPRSE